MFNCEPFTNKIFSQKFVEQIFTYFIQMTIYFNMCACVFRKNEHPSLNRAIPVRTNSYVKYSQEKVHLNSKAEYLRALK